MDGAGYHRLVAEVGAKEVGRRYAARVRASLDRLRDDPDFYRSESPGAVDDPDEWVDDVVRDGGAWDDPLDPEVRLELVVAAAEAAPDDDVLWCIGDVPADHLVGDAPQMDVRLHALRSTSERVNRMFEVMQADYVVMGLAAGWWSDDWPNSQSALLPY